MSDLKHYWEVMSPDGDIIYYQGFSETSAQKALGIAILEKGHQSIRVYRDHAPYHRITVVDTYELNQQSGWLDEQQYLDIEHYALLMKREGR